MTFDHMLQAYHSSLIGWIAEFQAWGCTNLGETEAISSVHWKKIRKGSDCILLCQSLA